MTKKSEPGLFAATTPLDELRALLRPSRTAEEFAAASKSEVKARRKGTLTVKMDKISGNKDE